MSIFALGQLCQGRSVVKTYIPLEAAAAAAWAAAWAAAAGNIRSGELSSDAKTVEDGFCWLFLY